MTHHIDQNAILQIRFHAESAAENAGAAYWAESYALVPLASEAPAKEAA
ncbi:hypothetical protein [Paracoccus yeei]